MWTVRTKRVALGTCFQVLRNGLCTSFRELFHLLETDGEFTSWYTGVLSSTEFEAFFWEHPPISASNYDDTAEFVLIDGPELALLRPSPEAFRSEFDRQLDEDVPIFANLGGDAVLVAPRPIGPPAAYAHLAAFARQAPAAQVRRLWQQTARAVRESLGSKPRWLSTAGMGVPWLHVRIDSTPKYYRFSPYRADPTGPPRAPSDLW